MGTWGTGISSNDDYADIYSEFFELYNDGKEVNEVTKVVIARNSEILSMPEAANNFWFAIAKAQWECKQLQPEIFNRVREIIESEADLRVWAELDAKESDIQKRRKVLEKFLSQLQSERPKAKARKKKIIREPLFKKGNCLTYKLTNDNFGGAVVLEAEYETELGLNLVAVTRINQYDKPTLADFQNAEVLVKNFVNWNGDPEVTWLPNYKSKEVRELVEVIGTIEVERDYLSFDVKHKYGFTSGWKMTLVDVATWQFESEKKKAKPIKKLTIKKLTKKNFWERFI